jgi:hypothetical protein
LYFVPLKRRTNESGKLQRIIEGVNVLYHPSMPWVSSNSIEIAFFILSLFPYQRKESRATPPSNWDFPRKGFLEKIFVLFCGWCMIVFYFSLFYAYYIFHTYAQNQ